ncbi:AbrB/MazE/SpoVT family DNA-binding domain-containing protein [Roseibacillus persicicus]|uniref:AbrB/MazE/SpoVT family DNA-binding domain-containing protein n=1 Tax=Roseibacillus persicicus TaxID=454148 RepID=UPI00398B2444
MENLTLNEKGQITIPAPLRKQLGISAGSQIRLFSEPGEKTLHLTPTGSIKDAFGILPKPEKALTIEEMNEKMETAVAEEVMSYERH